MSTTCLGMPCLCRLNGKVGGRIMDAVTVPGDTNTCSWVSGTYSGAGEVYHNGYMRNPSNATSTDKAYTGYGGDYIGQDWAMYSDTMKYARLDGTREFFSSTANCSSKFRLSINAGKWTLTGAEKTPWAVAMVLVYARVLTKSEMRLVGCSK